MNTLHMTNKFEIKEGYSGEDAFGSDTYIEQRFKYKCRALNNGDKIIVEWCQKKYQFISMLSMVAFNFQHYSLHDASHSVCIIQRIEEILGQERVDMLSAGDLWLILQAAYSHDLGMALTHEQLLNLWEKDENFKEYLRNCVEEDIGDLHKAARFYKEADNLIHKRAQGAGLPEGELVHFSDDWMVMCEYYLNILVSEYIRKQHAFRSKDKYDELDSITKPAIPKRLYEMSFEVNKMHGCDFQDILNNLKYRTEGFGKEKIHPQFVAVMLRLGDLLDIDNNRFDPYLIQHFGRLPVASLLHKKKHEAITHICICEDEISAEAETDEYEVAVISDEWFKMIDSEVKNLICYWNEIVPKELKGCRMKKSVCKTFLNNQLFDANQKCEFSVNKERLIDLLVGNSIYPSKMECIREYIQNAMDALKVQLWVDLERGMYDSTEFKNPDIIDNSDLTPFDLDRKVYDNYKIIVSVEWNQDKSKIRIEFEDNGIGIEYSYFSKLSKIGTGWHERTYYNRQINKMAKWLQPTGGFGIGMQSAFMVAESVHILTKSEQDAFGYEITLNKDKGGIVTTTELKNVQRGTVISYEIDPEKFQSWLRTLGKTDEEGFLGEKIDYRADLMDEFDEDGVLLYTIKFLHKYIQELIPNSFFPIVIRSSKFKESINIRAPWTKENYWEQESRHIRQKYDGKEYLGIDISQDNGSPEFLVWNKTDNIYVRFSKDNSSNRICYKNVLVRDKVKKISNLFAPYNVFVDIMGISVKKCLHLHRNSFREHFQVNDYVKECFRIYLYYLKEYYKQSFRINDDGENKKVRDDCWTEEWESFYLHLICIIQYPDIEVDSVVIENKKIGLEKLVKTGLDKIEVQKREEDASMFFDKIQSFYDDFYDNLPGDKTDTLNVLLIKGGSENQYINSDILLRQSILKHFMDGTLEMNELNYEKVKILNSLCDIGMITDEKTAKILMSDFRLSKRSYFMSGDLGLKGYVLEYKKSDQIVAEKDILSRLWSSNISGRVMIEVEKNSNYSELLVKELPFFNNEEQNRVFLISPLSNVVINILQRKLDEGFYLNYEEFRQLAWGKRGQESSSYNMLINWVLKHQIVNEYYTKEDIKDCYEKLLNDIYMEHIFPVCKKGK